MDDQVAQLKDRGFVWIRSVFQTSDEAFDAARTLIDADCAADDPEELSVIGDFVLPPIDGPPTREFQTLHFDFGLPLDPKLDQDVARYTALYIPRGLGSVSAVTRIVALDRLLSQRTWSPFPELLIGLIAYGRTHGAWDDARGYVEGSLARVVEGAAVSSPRLPSVKAEPGFLCGMEFDSLRSEVAFFELHGLCVKEVEVEVDLRPGELLVFDNLALAHGRRGTRRPGELRQRVYGHQRLSPAAQCELRDRVLSSFDTLCPASRRRRSEPDGSLSHRQVGVGGEPAPERAGRPGQGRPPTGDRSELAVKVNAADAEADEHTGARFGLDRQA